MTRTPSCPQRPPRTCPPSLPRTPASSHPCTSIHWRPPRCTCTRTTTTPHPDAREATQSLRNQPPARQPHGHHQAHQDTRRSQHQSTQQTGRGDFVSHHRVQRPLSRTHHLTPYCVASSLAAADAAREDASAIARDVRASVERAIARMSLTLRLSYICARCAVAVSMRQTRVL